MALLYDPLLEFLAKYSSQKLLSCSKSKRKPSAWTSPLPEKEVEHRKLAWAPRQMDMDDMLVVKALRVRSVLIGALYIRLIP